MNFHLEFTVAPFQERINYRHSFLFMGSCFAENIGEVMKNHKFKVMTNPNGIVYNPASIAIALRKHITNYRFDGAELFFANEVWNSWEHHSACSGSDKATALKIMNDSIAHAHTLLNHGEWLFLTFGSAYYYKRKATGQIVSNCHKIPQREFTKHLLTSSEIVNDYTALLAQLKEINPRLKIVFTVSPVRYIRDGVVENNRSKAVLLEAVHQLTEQHENVYYFPAYELVIDDLRDYRFYKKDLVHPNEQAIEYVFEKWKETAFDAETKVIFERIKKIQTHLNHRINHPNPETLKKHFEFQEKSAKELILEFPFLDLDL